MKPLFVPVDDFLCTAPGRLRHSWLGNQVRLLLRSHVERSITSGDLARSVSNWGAEQLELVRYVEAFPGIVDPGRFLQAYFEIRGASIDSMLCDALSTEFMTSFRKTMGCGVDDFRGKLSDAARSLDVALAALLEEIEPLVAKDDAADCELKATVALDRAAVDLQGLLGRAPRGVWLT